jgi:hypothetical protein
MIELTVLEATLIVLNIALAYLNFQLTSDLKKHNTAMAVMLYGIHSGKLKIVDVVDGDKGGAVGKNQQKHLIAIEN